LYPNTKEEFQKIFGALGFFYGQEITLDQIRTNLPSLRTDVALSQSQFNAEFGESKRTMEQIVNENFGEERLSDLWQSVSEQVSTILNYQDVKIEEAIEFLNKVKRRAEGQDLESPYFETILHYKYWQHPHNEMLEGYVETFQSKGHQKSAGLDFQLKVPRSFSVDEGDRPHVIKRFKSDEGIGPAIIIVLVQQIPVSEEKIDMRHNSDELNEGTAKAMMPEESQFISFKNIKIDGIPYGMLEYTSLKETVMGSIGSSNLMFFTFIDNRMVMISCSCAKDGADDSIYQIYLPTFKLVANSFIYNGQYKTE
jgi:hypothetical protein